MRTSKYTTILLIAIVIILLFGVGIALYYVLDLDWFEKNPSEINVYKEKPNAEVKIENVIKYDISKRTYNLLLDTQDLKVIVYKDGSVGVILKDNDDNKQVEIYKEILNKELKLEVKNIIRAYEVAASKTNELSTYILLLDVEGNLYSLDEKQLAQNEEYEFVKLNGLGKIIDVRQITNDDVIENATGINAVAIDEESNEILLTQYLVK